LDVDRLCQLAEALGASQLEAVAKDATSCQQQYKDADFLKSFKVEGKSVHHNYGHTLIPAK